jgi:putative restriction endonuclease
LAIGSDDAQIRAAAFERVRHLSEVYGAIPAAAIKEGFKFEGGRLPLWNDMRGIFKPRQMRHLLSITTRIPRPRTKVWYDDQREVHRQIESGVTSVEYSFMGADPNAADNRWLREAMESRVPIIYFIGVAPGLYEAAIPSFICGWDSARLKAAVVFGERAQAEEEPPEDDADRRYGLRLVKQRLHQTSFRLAVMDAYGGRCALDHPSSAIPRGGRLARRRASASRRPACESAA